MTQASATKRLCEGEGVMADTDEESLPTTSQHPVTAPIIITLPKIPPGQTIILPAIPRPSKPPPNRPSKPDRPIAIIIIFAAIALSVTFASITPAKTLVSPLLSWAGSGGVATIPTATPGPQGGSQPVVYGVHDFSCAALPFARLAQNQMTHGDRPLVHPWYVSVIIAQWGVEQGWTMPTYTGYNFGNVSAIGGLPEVPGTSAPGSPSAFAYASTAEQGATEYVIYVKNGLYDSVTNAWAGGAEAQALALGNSPWDAGHYTSDGRAGDTLISTMRIFNLQAFDQGNGPC